MRGFILVLILLAAAAGAGYYFYGARMMSAPAAVNAVNVPFTVLAHGDHSTESTRANYLIRSSAELSQLWKMTDAQGEPPTVDFSANSVIAVFAGEEPTAGYSISVTGVHDSDKRDVSVLINAPGGSCVLAQALTSPYQIIEVSASALPLAHEDSATTTSCLK